jgi:hypothetical protein
MQKYFNGSHPLNCRKIMKFVSAYRTKSLPAVKAQMGVAFS